MFGAVGCSPHSCGGGVACGLQKKRKKARCAVARHVTRSPVRIRLSHRCITTTTLLCAPLRITHITLKKREGRDKEANRLKGTALYVSSAVSMHA